MTATSFESEQPRRAGLTLESISSTIRDPIDRVVHDRSFFSSRLARLIRYESALNFNVGYRSVKGYAMASTDPTRILYDAYTTVHEDPHADKDESLEKLVSDPRGAAIEATQSIYRQFNWTRPPSADTLAQRQLEYYL